MNTSSTSSDTYFERVKISLLLGGSLAVLFFVLGPLTVFSANQSDFNLGFFEIVPRASIYAIAFLTTLCLLGLLTWGRVFQVVCGMLLGFLIAIYLQGFLFNMSYGVFDGSEINWEEYSGRYYGELILWCGTILTCTAISLLRPKIVPSAAFFVLLLGVGNIAATIMQGSIRWRGEKELPSAEQAFSFSAEQNVIFVLLDSFQSSLFSLLLEREPRYKELFKDFTFFTDTTTSYATTTASIPSILSGATYRNNGAYSDFMKAHLPNQSLPEILASKGYRSTTITLPQLCAYLPNTNCVGPNAIANGSVEELSRAEARQLFDLVLFRYSPVPLKKAIYADDTWFLQRIFRKRVIKKIPSTHVDSLALVEEFKKSANLISPQPAFLFLHLIIPHAPQRLNSRCQYIPPFVKMRSLERHSRQGLCAISLVDAIISKLKEINAYENSMIVVLADHGSSVSFSKEPRPEGYPKIEQALPILLVKRPNESTQALKTSDVPSSLIDLPKTVAETMNVDSQFPEMDIFKLQSGTVRQRVYHSYQWDQKYWLRNSLPPITEYLINGKASTYESWTKGVEIPSHE